MIYLDYTANAPVEPRALEAFCEAEGRLIGNANARHGAGREAADAMARAAAECAALLGVQPGELFFNFGMPMSCPLYSAPAASPKIAPCETTGAAAPSARR